MRRIISLVVLFILVLFVMFCYLLLLDPERGSFLIYQGDTFIPVGLFEKNTSTKIVNPGFWVLLGMFGLIYLKIIWKLVTFKFNTKNVKARSRDY